MRERTLAWSVLRAIECEYIVGCVAMRDDVVVYTIERSTFGFAIDFLRRVWRGLLKVVSRVSIIAMVNVRSIYRVTGNSVLGTFV